MATRSEDLAPIRPDEQYPLEVLERHAGQGRAAMRQARRNGLRVTYVSGRCYVLGRDWMDYCDQQGKASKDE